MQDHIARNRADARNRWIFNIIDGKLPHTEIVLAVRPEWTLCRDVGGVDGKWLVVLHDRALHSLRDFRSKHVETLLTISHDVKEILKSYYSPIDVSRVEFFVHYLPSTFQAHIHVHCPQVIDTDEERAHARVTSSRRHSLRHVVRNLLQDDLYYTKCMILSSMCKMVKSIGVYTCISSETADRVVFK